MTDGIRGRLVTTAFARDLLPAVSGAAAMPPEVRRAIGAWWRRADAALGPASSVRAIADVSASPLLHLLGYTIVGRSDAPDHAWLRLDAPVAALIVGWNVPLARAWRSAVLHAIAADAHWCLCLNGTTLRI